jgi:diguanylate cyclase (GGDEF)-like protein
MTSVAMRLVRKAGGEDAVTRWLEEARSERDRAYLEDVDNWISLEEAMSLLAAGAHETGDPHFARHVGENTLRQHSGTQVATVLRSLGSTEAVLQAIAQTAARLSAVTTMEAIEAAPGRGVVKACARDGFTRRPLHCEWTHGLLAGTPILFGLPLARVEENECQTRGDAHCLYTVTWDAELAAVAADPQQRVTSLEAQLVAMSERLQSSYSTASDLVSIDDLEQVLQRIVERASDAVRAPSHILAVRTAPEAELQVYSHGIEDSRAKELARSAQMHEDVMGESTLVVEVTSARHRYGHLIARYPGSVDFFPQDVEQLKLYAKHAAAVLDLSTALQESARRHDQVSSLLALSHALAEAGATEEVGARLASAVPAVVDCDRVGVFLWDQLEQTLTPLASSGHMEETAAVFQELTLSPGDTPSLRRMLDRPQPQLFDRATDDDTIRRLMATLGVVAVTVVPIVARDVFLGVLTVSVTDDPSRLRSDSEMLERLTGVAALAAPAIQNGRLVDELHHRASHDELTGLLNRAGFRAHVDRMVASGSQRSVGLLFVDLDGFKHVNDLHGHESGDELLRNVARRLEATTRQGDVVARLGGDEFAVVLAGGREDSQVQAAEARVREAFLEPFVLGDVAIVVGASVGSGVWREGHGTIADLLRNADSAMYAEKARGRRSPARV